MSLGNRSSATRDEACLSSEFGCTTNKSKNICTYTIVNLQVTRSSIFDSILFLSEGLAHARDRYFRNSRHTRTVPLDPRHEHVEAAAARMIQDDLRLGSFIVVVIIVLCV